MGQVTGVIHRESAGCEISREPSPALGETYRVLGLEPGEVARLTGQCFVQGQAWVPPHDLHHQVVGRPDVKRQRTRSRQCRTAFRLMGDTYFG